MNAQLNVSPVFRFYFSFYHALSIDLGKMFSFAPNVRKKRCVN